jgi:hypothetical protein
MDALIPLTRDAIYEMIWPYYADDLHDYGISFCMSGNDSMGDARCDAVQILLDHLECACITEEDVHDTAQKFFQDSQRADDDERAAWEADQAEQPQIDPGRFSMAASMAIVRPLFAAVPEPTDDPPDPDPVPCGICGNLLDDDNGSLDPIDEDSGLNTDYLGLVLCGDCYCQAHDEMDDYFAKD